MIHPDCIADDLRRKTIAGVTGAIDLPGTSVSTLPAEVDNARAITLRPTVNPLPLQPQLD